MNKYLKLFTKILITLLILNYLIPVYSDIQFFATLINKTSAIIYEGLAGFL